MALKVVSATVNQSLGDGKYNIDAAPKGAFVASTTVAANIATLVADGASPTQAHVTTLNTNWATFLAGHNLAIGNVSLVYDSAVVVNKNQLRAALSALLRQVDASDTLTP